MTVVGRYELLGEIGRGGMGRVYLARQLDLERTAALKCLQVGRDADAGSLRRFVSEAKLVGSLQHPALVTVFDVFEDGGAYYIGMEYLEAGTLRPLVGRLSHQQIGGVLESLLAGLQEAHRAGIVHRDLKPENLLLGRDGRVRIADFGIAKAIEGAERITATGTIVGTPVYMAPEQAIGAPASPASDLYAVGVIAYELIAGEPPFRGGSPISVLLRHQQEPPPPLTSRAPSALAAWVHRLLEKDPADRYASAEHAWHALEDVLLDIAGPRWRRDAPITAPTPPSRPHTPPSPAPDTPTETDTHRARPAVTPGVRPQRPAALAREYRSLFVGRGRELGRLWDAWRRAEGGERQLALLSGEPGIGKSRLAAEFARAVHERGGSVLLGRCSQEPLLPYQPFVEALRPLLPSALPDRLRDLERLIPGQAGEAVAVATGMEGAARFRLFEAVRLVLSEAGERQPLLLVLEDLHWADRPTLLLLSHLAGSPEPARVLLLVTYRDTELGWNNAVAELLADLRRDRIGIRLRLAGLGQDEVDTLIAAWGSGGTPTEEIHRRTDGNPFFVEELLSHLEESGEETARGGVPEGIMEVIERRVGRLADVTRTVLAAASVLGRRFDLHLLERVAEAVPAAGVADALDEVASAGLVREEPDRPALYGFSHALVRDAIHERLAATHRRRLHARAAAVLEDFYGDRPQRVGEIAHHLFEAATPALAERGIDFAVRAADLALAQLAYEDAVRHLERALRALDLVGRPDERRRCALLLSLGDAHTRAGDPSAGRVAFTAAAESARRVRSPELLARAALGFGGLGVTLLAVDEKIVARLEEALAALDDHTEASGLRARLLSRLAVELYYDPLPERSERLGTEALALARRSGDERVLAYALNARHVSLWRPDRLDERLELAREMVALGQRTGDRESELQARNWLVTDLFEAGLITELETAVDKYEELARDLRLPGFAWYATLWRASLVALRGDMDAAEPLLQVAEQAGRRSGDPNVELTNQVRVGVRLTRGDFEAVHHIYERIAPLKVDGSPASLAFRAAWGWSAAWSGRTSEARKHLDHLAGHGLDRLPFDVNWLDSVCCLAETCALLGDRERAASLYELLQPYAGRVATSAGRALLAHGVTDRHLGLVATTIGRHDEAERHFEAALRGNERLGFRPLVAWTHYQYGLMLRARDAPEDARRARAQLSSAAELASELSLDGLVSLCERAGTAGPAARQSG